MKKNVFTILIFGILQQLNAQVGINTSLPASTLEVEGSLQGRYVEITTASYTILPTDYHLSYSGTTNGILTLPTKSTLLLDKTDFRGRKYYIKNNSTTFSTTINTATGENFRFGGGKALANSYVLKPGNIAIITASSEGWDIDLVASTSVSNNWMLYDTSLDGYINGATSQTINTSTNWSNLTYDTAIKPNATGAIKPPVQVTVTVPPTSEYEQNRVILNFIGWGDALINATTGGRGSLRFFIMENTTPTNTVMMTSWSTNVSTPLGIRYSFPVNYVIENKPPGTYTYKLLITKEDENTTATVRLWTVQAKAEVYVKNN